MRVRGTILAGVSSAALWLGPAVAQTVETCERAEFEVVVDQAAAALRDLNSRNKPAFQDKLRRLKNKRGWSHDQFMTAAAPFVRDEQIALYDQKSENLLSAISSMGQEGSAAESPDCALLLELRARMTVLVETQTAKWAYMFKKLDGELAK